jgi:hypothetical protein
VNLLALPLAQWPEDARDEYEVRAAVMEHDGSLTRERAEVEARKRVAERWEREHKP